MQDTSKARRARLSDGNVLYRTRPRKTQRNKALRSRIIVYLLILPMVEDKSLCISTAALRAASK